jgi:hypothetical protein
MSIVHSRRGLMHAVAVAFGALTLARGSGRSRTLIQGDEAAAESQVLFTAVVEELPAPPAIVRLVRAVVGPGGELPEQTNEGPAFLLLERGALSLQVEGEAIVSRAERGGTPGRGPRPRSGRPGRPPAGGPGGDPGRHSVRLRQRGRGGGLAPDRPRAAGR